MLHVIAELTGVQKTQKLKTVFSLALPIMYMVMKQYERMTKEPSMKENNVQSFVKILVNCTS